MASKPWVVAHCMLFTLVWAVFASLGIILISIMVLRFWPLAPCTLFALMPAAWCCGFVYFAAERWASMHGVFGLPYDETSSRLRLERWLATWTLDPNEQYQPKPSNRQSALYHSPNTERENIPCGMAPSCYHFTPYKHILDDLQISSDDESEAAGNYW